MADGFPEDEASEEEGGAARFISEPTGKGGCILLSLKNLVEVSHFHPSHSGGHFCFQGESYRRSIHNCWSCQAISRSLASKNMIQ